MGIRLIVCPSYPARWCEELTAWIEYYTMTLQDQLPLAVRQIADAILTAGGRPFDRSHGLRENDQNFTSVSSLPTLG